MGVASVTRGAASMLVLTALLLVSLGGNGGPLVDAYSKYGRGCGDIGCLPSEECIISSDSCSFSQRDGKDCGNYPTCKRKIGGSSSTQTSSVNPSGSSLNTGPENNVFAPASSNPTLNTYTYFNHNNNNQNQNQNQHQNQNQNPHQHHQQSNQNGAQNGGSNNANGRTNLGLGLGLGSAAGSNGNNGNTAGGSSNNGGSAAEGVPGIGTGAGGSAAGIDPHYVFGAKHHMPVIPNMPIFPYNSPTSAPSFQQFPQPNHPGSVLNPGYPMHGLQPVNPYNPPFVFGQVPFYNSPSGTGGPPGGSAGILGGSGGGLAPYGSNYNGNFGGYQNPNMYNKPPPQYQNQNQQNPYNRQTQSHPSAAARIFGTAALNYMMIICLVCLLLLNVNLQQHVANST